MYDGHLYGASQFRRKVAMEANQLLSCVLLFFLAKDELRLKCEELEREVFDLQQKVCLFRHCLYCTFFAFICVRWAIG